MKFTVAIIATFAGLALAAPQNKGKVDLTNCDDAADLVFQECKAARAANCLEESSKEKLKCQGKKVQSNGKDLVAENQASERAKNKAKAVADAKNLAQQKDAEKFKKQQEVAKQKAAEQKAAKQKAAKQKAA